MRGYKIGFFALTVYGCVPAPGPPIVPDANVDGGCQTLDKITAEREIRDPATGYPMIVHCDGSTTTMTRP